MTPITNEFKIRYYLFKENKREIFQIQELRKKLKNIRLYMFILKGSLHYQRCK